MLYIMYEPSIICVDGKNMQMFEECINEQGSSHVGTCYSHTPPAN